MTKKRPGAVKLTDDEVVEALSKRQRLTRKQMQVLFGVSDNTVLLRLRNLGSRVRIADWLPPQKSGGYTPVYAMRAPGDEDVPPPDSKKQQQKSQTMRDHAQIARNQALWGAISNVK